MGFSYYNCLVATLILTFQHRWFFLKKHYRHQSVKAFHCYSEANIGNLKFRFLNKKILRLLKRKKNADFKKWENLKS